MHFLTKLSLFLALTCSAGHAQAQSLSVEELRAKIDARVAAMNPYQELLADPDPARSMAAIEIMLESQDPVLMRMAIEFGLLSNAGAVRRVALEAYLKQGPTLTMELDGSVTKSESFTRILRDSWKGSQDAEGRMFTSWKVGEFDSGKGCFLFAGYGQCFVRLSADSVSIEGSGLAARLSNDGSGQLTGSATVSGTDEVIPMTIALID